MSDPPVLLEEVKTPNPDPESPPSRPWTLDLKPASVLGEPSPVLCGILPTTYGVAVVLEVALHVQHALLRIRRSLSRPARAGYPKTQNSKPEAQVPLSAGPGGLLGATQDKKIEVLPTQSRI